MCGNNSKFLPTTAPSVVGMRWSVVGVDAKARKQLENVYILPFAKIDYLVGRYYDKNGFVHYCISDTIQILIKPSKIFKHAVAPKAPLVRAGAQTGRYAGVLLARRHPIVFCHGRQNAVQPTLYSTIPNAFFCFST